MDIRAQIPGVFHLDKCIGCHTCSISCKNIWTDRKGAEYMWWNNVETKPGTGYPTKWEDQRKYQGGWVLKNEELRLRGSGKIRGLANIFHNPNLPTIDDYYEPWTYKYDDLYNSPAGDDQPIARPISLITGEEMNIEAGPNWDDDLSGSPIYANNDPNFSDLTQEEKDVLFELEQLVFFHVPRTCNHCLNPGCVASCPSGAIYKRGEDGIVLINQDKCRGWRQCVSGCPYKKSFYNWGTGKSEKCIHCFPRLESGQPPACFHSCPGRIRYLGVLLYDADKILSMAKAKDENLIEAQRDAILNPFDAQVIAAARKNGISDEWIKSAQQSPVYKFVKEWELALPLHAEFRTVPMLFYVPPLLPIVASINDGIYDTSSADFFGTLDKVRVPIRYLAKLFSAGNEKIIEKALVKLLAVRNYMRNKTVGDLDIAKTEEAMRLAGCSVAEAEQIHRLTSLSTFNQRMVIPPFNREVAIEEIQDPETHKGETGIGYRQKPKRGA